MRLFKKRSCFSYLVSLGCLLLDGMVAGEYTEDAVPVKLEDGVSCLVSDEEVASSTINSNPSWLLNKLIIKSGVFWGHLQGGYGRHLASDRLSFSAKNLSFLGENLVFFMFSVIKI